MTHSYSPRVPRVPRVLVLSFFLALVACENAAESRLDGASGEPADAGPVEALSFGEPGPVAGSEGRASFRFGVATAATQIEDMNSHTDWYTWTQEEPEGLGKGSFVGDAVQGYSRAVEDVGLIEEMNLDAYRFSVEWARVEPERDRIDEAALSHYGDLLDALVSRSIAPMITVHHFSNPRWVDDPRQSDCSEGPTDDWLCGWHHEEGGELVIEELAEHARLLGQRFGDRVDDWCTINEPVNYIFAAYGTGVFPPGRNLILTDFERMVAVYRRFVAAHVAIYEALKEGDTVDADGDGVAANVGFSLSVADWVPSYNSAPSDGEEHVAAAQRMRYVYQDLFVRSILEGSFDADLDQRAEEEHPDWAGKIDWLGLQYYFRSGVTAAPALFPVLNFTPCFPPLDFGACIAPEDPTHWVPTMGYEFYAPGLGSILREVASRWPELPLMVTEGGIATEVGARRAENIVRSLEQISEAIAAGADIRGYYHWSLLDNFEWAEGYEPRFGLYRVEREEDYRRVATEGAEVLGQIAGARVLSESLRRRYGGNGPMTEEIRH